ncbi:MAG: hypothetical protein HYT27_02925, partial [Parcubacteria group bacterium]|nr:hypothetical protein [Parcubacteria group bacterium]
MSTIKNAGMFVAAVNITELFSTEALLDTIKNIEKGYDCIIDYLSQKNDCFVKTEKTIADKGLFMRFATKASSQFYKTTRIVTQTIKDSAYRLFTSETKPFVTDITKVPEVKNTSLKPVNILNKISARFYHAVNNITQMAKSRALSLFTPKTSLITVETPDITEATLRLTRSETEGIFTQDIPSIATTTVQESKQEVVFNKINDDTLRAREGVTKLEREGLAVESTAGQQTVVERIIERVVAGITPADVAVQLNTLENKLRQEIFKVSESSSGGIRIVERQVALTNKIDQLPDVTLINATVSGTFEGLTDAHIPNDITADNYLLLAGGNITGTLGVGTSTPTEDFAVANRLYVGGTGTSTIENNLSIGGALGVGDVCLNCADNTVLGGAVFSVSGTSTFSGPLIASYVPPNAHTFSTWEIDVTNANATTSSFVINPTSAGSDTNLFGIAVNDNVKFLIDAEGDVFANSVTAVGGTTLSTTTASTFTVESTSTFGDSTTTDRTYFNSRIGSSLIPTADNLLDIGDTTNALAWRTGIFGTSIGIGTTSPYEKLAISDGNLFVGGVITSTSTATSTFSGFLDVTGTNSTSTFSGGLAADRLNITGSASSTFFGGIILADGNLTLSTNGVYLINDTLALSASTLGASVVNSSLTSVGTLSSLTVSGLASLQGGFVSSASSSVTTLHGDNLFASSTIVVDGQSLFALTGGNVGIGTTSPGTLFSVGGSSSITTLHGDNFFASSTIVADGQALFALTGGSVGIGTTSPSKRLSVSDEVSDAQVAIAYDATRYAHLQVDSAGDLIIDAQGGDIRFNDENLFVCASGSCPTGTPSAQGSIIAETEIGIGTSSPVAQLGVANNIFIGGGGAPSLGTATSTFEGDIIIL